MCYTEWYGLLVICAIGYYYSFMFGLGGVIFLYCSEILPPSGASFTWVFHWGTAAINGKFSVLAVDSVGTGSVFMYYSLMSFVVALLTGLWIRETKGKSLKQIEEDYEKAHVQWND